MNAIRKYGVVARVGLQNTFAYRVNFIGSLLFYALFIFVFFHLWRAIYAGGELAGYSLAQMVWYLCMTELVVHGCKTGVAGQIGSDIQSGAISYQLGRPYSYISYQFANAMGRIASGFAFFLVGMIVLGMVFVGPLPTFTWHALPLVVLSAVLGIVIQFFLQTTVGMTAFVLEDNTAMLFLFNKFVFMLGMFMPIEILPGWLQMIAKSLPFSYVAWAPARLLVAFSWEEALRILPMQIAWAAASIGICAWFFRHNMKNLQANGG